MKPLSFGVPLVAVLLALAGPGRADETFDAALKQAGLQYEQRLRQASDELVAARSRIAGEKAPLLERLRAAQDRIIAAESEASRLRTGHEQADDQRRRLLRQLDESRKAAGYLQTLAHDSLEALSDGFAPGEAPVWQDQVDGLRRRLEQETAAPTGSVAADVATQILEHTRRSLGGYSAPGRALLNGTSELLEGQFAFAGPETYFQPADRQRPAGTVRSREGSSNLISYPLGDWSAADAAAFFAGQPARVIADASGGKALQLQENRGSLWEHIDKGGVVAYVIVVVGLAALLMILQKVRDLGRISVNDPATVQPFLAAVAAGTPADAEHHLAGLTGATRELLQEGWRQRHEPKAILEEHLEAALLDQRLFGERRLPLLAVIATAAPLMGLLGTVVGMVKTFALITVFGTGNAAKLSSGISEVLVATELGLIVAIPTLVAHGFLTHRLHKKLAQLERCALQFVTAVERGRVRGRPESADALSA